MAAEQDDVLEAIEEHTKAVDGSLAGMKKTIAALEKQAKADREEREALERKFNLQSVSGTPDVHALAKADGEKFREFFSGGTNKKEMLVGVDPQGGYTVLPHFSNQLTQIIRDQNPLRGLARVVNITSDSFEEIEDIDDLTATWVSETGGRPETTTPSIGKLRIEAHEIYAAPKVSQKLLDDSSFDIAGWLAEKIGSRFARSELAAYTTGNGVGQPRGFTTYPTAATADATRAWGVLEHVNTGANGTFHTTQGDPLIDLTHALKPGYRQGAAWLMTRQVSAAIRKFKVSATSEYVWQPGLQAGQPDMLLGFPVHFCEDLPAMATGSLSCWFGNWQRAYTIVDRIATRILQDPYTSKPWVIVYAYRRTGGQVTNFEAIKALRFSA